MSIKSQMKNQRYYAKKERGRQAVEELKKDIHSEVITEAWTLAMAISMKVLIDDYGFGSKRLGDFAEHAAELYNNDVSIEEVTKYIEQRTGIVIKSD